MPYAGYETWFAVVLLMCLNYMNSELPSYSGAVGEHIFGLREGPKISQPDECELAVLFNC